MEQHEKIAFQCGHLNLSLYYYHHHHCNDKQTIQREGLWIEILTTSGKEKYFSSVALDKRYF